MNWVDTSDVGETLFRDEFSNFRGGITIADTKHMILFSESANGSITPAVMSFVVPW